MSRDEIILKLKPLIEEELRRRSFLLVDIRFLTRKGSGFILEVLVDRPEGGITLGECAALSRELGSFIEETGQIYCPYVLDISSPGLDRPLVTEEDFKRSLGRDVRLFLKEAVAGRVEVMGKIKSVNSERVILELSDTAVEIPFEKVNKAKQVIL